MATVTEQQLPLTSVPPGPVSLHPAAGTGADVKEEGCRKDGPLQACDKVQP